MRTGIEKVTDKQPMSREHALAKGRDSVSDALTYLTSSKVQNFYARVINLMDRVAVPGFGTMGVSAHAGKYLFLYDPLFAAGVSYEEVCATCEHEVMHLILEHIPRHLVLKRLYSTDADRKLLELTANLAMDLADNELLARSWPKIKDKEQPIGFWVIPENFEPHLPRDMSYEGYQQLLMELLSKRLDSSPSKLYNLAKKILQKQSEAVKDALKQQSKNNGDLPDEDKEKEEGAGTGSGSGEGQAEPGQDPQQGSGSGQGSESDADKNPFEDMSPEEIEKEIGNLDPVDQKVLEMLIKASQPHLAWGEGDLDESEVHSLSENGKELIRQSVTSDAKSRGTIPGHVMELIRKMLTPPTVSWVQLLHNIVQRTRQTKKERGMARPSKKLAAMKIFLCNQENLDEEENPLASLIAQRRRMPVFPGVKRSNKYTIYYVVDTSGSMSAVDLQLGLSELQHIQKSDSDVSICVIYADTQVCTEYWITATGEIDENMTGRGGTDFELVFQHVKSRVSHQDKAPDILIYCTDGYAPPPSTRLPLPTVWLLTPNGAPICKDVGHITLQMKQYQLEDAHV